MPHTAILVDRSSPDSMVSPSITLQLSLKAYLIIILQANTCSTLTSGTSAVVPREKPHFYKCPRIRFYIDQDGKCYSSDPLISVTGPFTTSTSSGVSPCQDLVDLGTSHVWNVPDDATGTDFHIEPSRHHLSYDTSQRPREFRSILSKIGEEIFFHPQEIEARSGKKHSELMSPKHDKPPNNDLISIVDCDSTTIITSDQAQQLKTPGFSHMSHSVILVDRSIPDSLVSLSITLKLSLTTYLIIIL